MFPRSKWMWPLQGGKVERETFFFLVPSLFVVAATITFIIPVINMNKEKEELHRLGRNRKHYLVTIIYENHTMILL